jgi:hypothetical protein
MTDPGRIETSRPAKNAVVPSHHTKWLNLVPLSLEVGPCDSLNQYAGDIDDKAAANNPAPPERVSAADSM